MKLNDEKHLKKILDELLKDFLSGRFSYNLSESSQLRIRQAIRSINVLTKEGVRCQKKLI